MGGPDVRSHAGSKYREPTRWGGEVEIPNGVEPRWDYTLTQCQPASELAPGRPIRSCQVAMARTEPRLDPDGGKACDAFDTLPPDEQLLLEMVVFQGLSMRQVARLTGLSKSQIHRRKAKAVAALRKALVNA